MDNKKDIPELLDEAIRSGLESLNGAMDSEYADKVDSISKLYKLRLDEIENTRAFMARSDETIDKERDYQLRQEQARDDRTARQLKFTTDFLGVALPTTLYALCFIGGLKFEKEGTFTSFTVKSLFSKLKIW